MDKKKINLDVRPEKETTVFQDKNGNSVVILKTISAADKEAFAQEWVEQTIGTDDELGVCYKLMTEEEVYSYLLVKYYTDIDVEDIKEMDDIRNLYDFCRDTGLREAIAEHIDLYEADVVLRMADTYRESICKLYEAGHSLGQIVKRLMNTDPDMNNAETRELIEKLIDMKGALLAKEEENKVLQFWKKSSNVKTGGAKLNLAKR